jgi:ABC-2 type transport system permease protein
MEEGIAIGRIYLAAIVYLPALFVMIGLALFLLGFAPKLLV